MVCMNDKGFALLRVDMRCVDTEHHVLCCTVLYIQDLVHTTGNQYGRCDKKLKCTHVPNKN